MNYVDIRLVTEDAFFSEAIDWFTQSRYSHAGALLKGQDGELLELGSRVGNDGAKAPGVQTRPANYAKFSRTLVLRFTVSAYQESQFWDFLTRQIDKPYDKEAIAGLVVGRDWHKPDAWFCSELIAAALEYAGIIRKITAELWRIVPGTLGLICEATGAEIVS